MTKYLMLLLTVLSCGRTPVQQSDVKTDIPGEDSSMAVLMGQGIDHISWKAKGHCVDLGATETQSGQATGQKVEYRLISVESQAQLREALNISASASLSFGLFGNGSARMNFAHSLNKNSQTRYLMVHTRVANQLEIAKSFKLSDHALGLVKTGSGALFTDHCGTEFVYARRTGGEFYAVFEFEFHSKEEEQHFDAAVSASGFGWKASTQINHDLAKFNLTSRVNVHMLRQGGQGALPDVNGIEEFARKFPELIRSTSGSPITLQLITKDYKGVEFGENPLTLPMMEFQERIVNELAKQRDRAFELINTIGYIKRNTSIFTEVDVMSLSDSEVQLNKFVNSIYDQTIDCFTDHIEGCKLPTNVMPQVDLPVRHPRYSCEDDMRWFEEKQQCCALKLVRGECLIPGENDQCLVYDELTSQLTCN